MKLPGEISLRNDLPIWAMPSGKAAIGALLHVEEIDENALRRFGPEIHHAGVFLDRPKEGLEHEVELSSLTQLAAAHRAYPSLGRFVGAEAAVGSPRTQPRDR